MQSRKRKPLPLSAPYEDGYKKLKTETGMSEKPSNDPRTTARIVNTMLAKILHAPVDYIAPELQPYAEYLSYLAPKDIQTIAFTLKILDRFSERSYLDYIYFLLHPITCPRKCRPPGMITNPLGTEIRCIRGFSAFSAESNIGEYRFLFSPTHYNLGSKDTGAVGGEYDLGLIVHNAAGTGTLTRTLGHKTGLPDNYSIHWKTCRIIAGEIQMNIIMAKETEQGRVVISPVYNSSTDSVAVLADALAPASSEAIMDNKIVYDGPAVDGCRMVYFPVHSTNFDFHNVAVSGQAGVHAQRMDYVGAIRGLPTGARVEIRSALYFELTVAEGAYELITDPTESQPEIVVGSLTNVMDALQDPMRNITSLLNLRKELQYKAATQQQVSQGDQYMKQYMPRIMMS